MSDLIDRQSESTRTFVELVVRYPDPELCIYKEYKGKPYYSIKYIENGETHVGYSTYNPEVLSRYLKEYFISSAPPTLGGYDIEHLILIANVLKKENLPPERVTEALTDIGSIVGIVRDEYEEILRKAVEQCMI